MARILIIDDDESVRGALLIMLQGQGHDVEEASGGRRGMLLEKATGFDVIITDLLMPDMDGLETIRELRKMSPGVKIIAISGGGLNKPAPYLTLAEKLGADFSLSKPFTKAELTIALGQLLKKQG